MPGHPRGRRPRASPSGGRGPRYSTNTMLRFRADHAAAKDAVRLRGRPRAARASWGCSSSPRARPTSRPSCSAPISAARSPTRRAPSSTKRIGRSPTLVVIYGDGLSAAAINQHLRTFHGALVPALAARGIAHAPAFFVRRSRVKIMDEIARLVRRAGRAVRLRRAPRPRLRRLALRLLHLSAGRRRHRRRPRGDLQHQPARPPARRRRARRRRRRSSASCATRSRASSSATGERAMKLDLPPVKPRALAVRTHPRRRARSRRACSICPPIAARSASSPPPPTTRSSPRSIRGPRPRPPTSSTPSRSTPAPRTHRGRSRASASASTPRAIPPRSTPRSPPASPTSRTRPGSTASRWRAPRRRVVVLSARHRLGRPLPGAAGRTCASGSALAYLIAPPLESVVGLDAACKAAPRALAKWFGPPSETNFGGGYLVGDPPAARRPRAPSPTPSSTSAAAPRRGDPRVVAGAGDAARAGATRSRATDRFRALDTGERFAEKPDHLTHLRRRRFAGAEDTPAHRRCAASSIFLQSALLDAQVAADADGARGLVGELGEILELARALVGRRGDRQAQCRHRRCGE